MSSLYGGSGLRGPTGAVAGNSMGSMLQRGGSLGNRAPTGYEQFQKYTPEQMQLFQDMFSHVGPESYLSKLAGGDQDIFNQIEAPALQQFSGLQGNLASRFSGMGSGARRSSGFQNTSNQAATDFASQLQSQRQALRQNAISELMGLSGDLLNKEPFGHVKKQKPWWEELLMTFGKELAGGAGRTLSGRFLE